MKKIIYISCILAFFSCRNTDKEAFPPQEQKAATDSILGNDKDSHGCITSAGFVWSQVNKDCIRPFSGIQLLPKDNQNEEDETLCTYLFFDENKETAEIFLPSEDNSILLKRSGKSNVWVKGSYKIVGNKGYQLYHNNELLFLGDGQIGEKISGSNDSEESDIPETE